MVDLQVVQQTRIYSQNGDALSTVLRSADARPHLNRLAGGTCDFDPARMRGGQPGSSRGGDGAVGRGKTVLKSTPRPAVSA